MDVGLNLLRILLGIINLIFFLLGVVFLIFGAWLKLRGERSVYTSYVSSDDAIVVPISMIVIGFIIIAITAIGLYGIIRLRRSWLCVYVFLLVTILLMQAIPMIMVFASKETLKMKLTKSFKKRVQFQYGVKPKEVEIYDKIQRKLKCCGAENYSDWFESIWWGNQSAGPVVPLSCCRPDTNETTCNMGTPNRIEVLDPKLIFLKGCAIAIIELLSKYTKTIVAVVCSVFGIQFISVLGACIVLTNIDISSLSPPPPIASETQDGEDPSSPQTRKEQKTQQRKDSASPQAQKEPKAQQGRDLPSSQVQNEPKTQAGRDSPSPQAQKEQGKDLASSQATKKTRKTSRTSFS